MTRSEDMSNKEWTSGWVQPSRQPIPGLSVDVELSTIRYNGLMSHLVQLECFDAYTDAYVCELASISGGDAKEALRWSRKRRKHASFLRAAILDWVSEKVKDDTESSSMFVESLEVKDD